MLKAQWSSQESRSLIYEQVWLTLSAVEPIPQHFPFSGARTWVLQGSNLQTGTSWLSRQLSFESVEECSSRTVSIHTGMHQLRLLMTRREFTILNATDHCGWNHSCDWDSLTLRVSSETRDISEQGPPHPFHLDCEGAKKFPSPWLFQVQVSGGKDVSMTKEVFKDHLIPWTNLSSTKTNDNGGIMSSSSLAPLTSTQLLRASLLTCKT